MNYIVFVQYTQCSCYGFRSCASSASFKAHQEQPSYFTCTTFICFLYFYSGCWVPSFQTYEIPDYFRTQWLLRIGSGSGKFKQMDEHMDVSMDIDPSLSLTAEGLWSDEESVYNPPSDSDDPDLPSTSAPTTPKKKVIPSLPVQNVLLTSRAADESMKSLLHLKSRLSFTVQLDFMPRVIFTEPRMSSKRSSKKTLKVSRDMLC